VQVVKSVIRPDKVEAVKDALARTGIAGVIVTVQVECVVADHLVEAAIDAIIAAARTGEIGDGRVFVTGMTTSYKIRTGERE